MKKKVNVGECWERFVSAGSFLYNVFGQLYEARSSFQDEKVKSGKNIHNEIDRE